MKTEIHKGFGNTPSKKAYMIKSVMKSHNIHAMVISEARLKEQNIKLIKGYMLQDGFNIIGTEGSKKNSNRFIAGGVSIIWDRERLQLLRHKTHLLSRIIAAEFEILGTSERITIIGTYMPNRQLDHSITYPAWQSLISTATLYNNSWIIGDLNAETLENIEDRNTKSTTPIKPTTSDHMLDFLRAAHSLHSTSTGTPTHSQGGEIDHIVCPSCDADQATPARVLPIDESDHSLVYSDYRYTEDRTGCGKERELGINLKLLYGEDPNSWLSKWPSAERTLILNNAIIENPNSTPSEIVYEIQRIHNHLALDTIKDRKERLEKEIEKKQKDKENTQNKRAPNPTPAPSPPNTRISTPPTHTTPTHTAPKYPQDPLFSIYDSDNDDSISWVSNTHTNHSDYHESDSSSQCDHPTHPQTEHTDSSCLVTQHPTPPAPQHSKTTHAPPPHPYHRPTNNDHLAPKTTPKLTTPEPCLNPDPILEELCTSSKNATHGSRYDRLHELLLNPTAPPPHLLPPYVVNLAEIPVPDTTTTLPKSSSDAILTQTLLDIHNADTD